jgi:hypothetical protein
VHQDTHLQEDKLYYHSIWYHHSVNGRTVCRMRADSWRWACWCTKHVEDYSVTYILLMNKKLCIKVGKWNKSICHSVTEFYSQRFHTAAPFYVISWLSFLSVLLISSVGRPYSAILFFLTKAAVWYSLREKWNYSLTWVFKIFS